MREITISVASYTLSLRLDSDSGLSGTLVREPDGIEARFNGPECLPHLLEGMVGRRAWLSHGQQILASLKGSCACA